MIDVLMSAAGSPGRTRAYTPSVSDSPLLAAQGGQKARIGAGVFLDDLQAAVIVQQICEGQKNKEIAQALSITAGTVKVHLMHIFEKTGVKDRFRSEEHTSELQSL